MSTYLYFRTYWGDPSGPGMSGRNVLARTKYELVQTCVKSLELLAQKDVHTCACVDYPTPEYMSFLRATFDETFETREGFDVDDHRGMLPVFGGMGNLIQVLNHIRSKGHRPDDVILLLEDDYLFREGGLAMWIEACRRISAFVSPFDHPDRYVRSDDLWHRRSDIVIANNTHFRTAESTTSVVGGKYRFFERSHLLRKIPRIHFWKFWPERVLGRELPSIDRVFYRRAKMFLGIDLYSPIPGFATHLSKFIPPEDPRVLKKGVTVPLTQLSPGVNWEERFRQLASTT